jgi:hypothetical protein
MLLHTSTFPFPLFNFLSLLFKKQFSLLWLFLYLLSSSTSLSLSPLELLDLFISPINYLTFSSTFLSLSSLKLPDLFISQLIAPRIFYLNLVLRFFFSLHVVPMVLLLFESQRCVLFPLISDWFCQVSCFYLFLYLVFSVLLNFFFWCSLFSWFYNFVVPKFFSRNVLIVVLTLFVFCCQYKQMLYNIILDIFPVYCMGL